MLIHIAVVYVRCNVGKQFAADLIGFAVENFKGSRLEKLAMLYCKQLGINYKNLSEEEFRWLIRILQKSKKMGTPISQRKKR